MIDSGLMWFALKPKPVFVHQPWSSNEKIDESLIVD